MAFGSALDPDSISSPLTLLNQLIDTTWLAAETKSAAYSAKSAAADSYLDSSSAPQISDPTDISQPELFPPIVDIPETVDDSVVLYETQYKQVMDELTARMTLFIAEHFPDESGAFSRAQAWLQNALDNPADAGIPEAVRDAIFEDQRSRILSDAERAKSSVIGAFASRGFPLPPGQAAGAIIEIERKAQGEIAAGARGLAKLALDFQQFSISQLLNLRQSAMGATISYIQTMATSPGDAAKITNMQSELIRSAADFYRANIAAEELKSRVSQFNTSLGVDVATKNQAAKLSLIGERAKTLMADAQSVAQMASALYNNLHASVGGSTGYSGSVNHNWNYEGN